MKALMETVGSIDKRKLERACNGGFWLTVFTSFQDGTELSIEEFRDDLRWRLSLNFLTSPPPPLKRNGFDT